jgi:hypothetical protein
MPGRVGGEVTTTEIPLKPFPTGKIAEKFGGPAKSPLEVLERSRVALSPRGSWKKAGYQGKSYEGATRCLIQTMTDVDGVHVKKAQDFVLKAAKEITGVSYSSIPNFNDAKGTYKHTVIMVLDRAIEMAQ